MTNKNFTPLEVKQPDPKTKLKEKFLSYFRELPLQHLAGASIGRDPDTISRWKSEDKEFAEQIELIRSEWALKNVKSVRSKEWLLERIMREEFRPPQLKTDITSGGKPIPILGGISNVQPNNSDKETSNT